MSLFTEKQLEEYLKGINRDDLISMFNSSVASFIKNRPQEEVENKLIEYISYDVPASLGDVIKIVDDVYVVTCVYSDNSVDLLSDKAKKINKGLYGVSVSKVGELQCITVQ